MDFVIAVDGTAASGKGTIAAYLAAVYGLPYLDTGLLYRAVGREIVERGGDPDDPLVARAVALSLDVLPSSNSPELQTGPVGDAASQVAAHAGVRAVLYELQRAFALRPGGAVLDGRDIGTVIAPEAPAKLWIDASLEVRARRRWLQVQANGDDRPLAAMIDALALRDTRDAGRASAPMVRAADAALLDTGEMDISQAADAARRIVEAARARWLETL